METEEDKDVCQGCGCAPKEKHVCPYRDEINADTTTLCNCCDGCTRQCAEDI